MDRLSSNASIATPQKRLTRSRNALQQALLSLLPNTSFDKLTAKDIAEAAGVGYATFFRHYPDKEALLQDLAAGEIRKLLTMTLPLLYTVEPRPSTQALCAYVWAHKEVWSALLNGGAAGVLKEEFIRQAHEVSIVHPKKERELPDSLIVTFSVAAAIEIIGWWLREEAPPSVDEMALHMERLVVRPTMGGF